MSETKIRANGSALCRQIIQRLDMIAIASNDGTMMIPFELLRYHYGSLTNPAASLEWNSIRDGLIEAAERLSIVCQSNYHQAKSIIHGPTRNPNANFSRFRESIDIMKNELEGLEKACLLLYIAIPRNNNLIIIILQNIVRSLKIIFQFHEKVLINFSGTNFYRKLIDVVKNTNWMIMSSAPHLITYANLNKCFLDTITSLLTRINPRSAKELQILQSACSNRFSARNSATTSYVISRENTKRNSGKSYFRDTSLKPKDESLHLTMTSLDKSVDVNSKESNTPKNDMLDNGSRTPNARRYSLHKGIFVTNSPEIKDYWKVRRALSLPSSASSISTSPGSNKIRKFIEIC